MNFDELKQHLTNYDRYLNARRTIAKPWKKSQLVTLNARIATCGADFKSP